MSCMKCKSSAVIELQHGDLCEKHFIEYFENKVFKTISKYNMISREDILCVAASGGKDSLTVLYLTKKYLEKNQIPAKLFALSIDEGINNYREKTMQDLVKFCEEHEISLHVKSFKEEFNHTLDYAQEKTQKRPCNICGVWRRYLLNKYAQSIGANKLVTGHNLDDESQVFLMNIFKANTTLAANLGPLTGVEQKGIFAQRIKPLYLVSEKETRLYTYLKGWQVQYGECPYSREGFRSQVRDMLNDFEVKYPGTKQSIIKSFLSILPDLKKDFKEKSKPISSCENCKEPSKNRLCNACKLKNEVQSAK